MDFGSHYASLAVIGAGPKAAALAAKASVLQERKLGRVDVLVFERKELAAHWNGLTGFTDGHGTNVTPPEKDVGFPYKSQFGIEVDNGMMMQFSWAAYQISLGSYAEWIDRGCPRPRHEVWGRYIGWVLRKSGAKVHYRTVTRIERDLKTQTGLVIVTKDRGVESRFEVDGVVFTGPGRNQSLVADSLQPEEEIDNANNYWLKIPDYESIPSGKVAVIGGGETAASVAISVLERNENLKVEIINRHGTFFSRGESFFERQLFSSNVGWAERTRENRREIIDRSDRALVSAKSLTRLAELSHRVVFRSARVASWQKNATEVTLRFEGQPEEASYDRVINAAGFDNWTPFELLSEGLRPVLSADKKEARQQKDAVVVDQHLRAPWVDPPANIHVPMISGVSRGPGIPGLSSLGMLADAILNAYVAFP